MEEYIPKSALVAEIEKLQLCTMDEHMNFYSAEAQGEYNVLSKLESFLDTLEVKDVDLELNSFDATVCKIGSTYLKEMDKDAIIKVLEPYKDGDKVKVIIKAQKGK